MSSYPEHQLAGEYQLCPGQQPGIRGGRPLLQAGRLGILLRGKSPAQVLLVLRSVFALCAHAHCRTASLLLGLAVPAPSSVKPPEAAVFHLLETARDHLRSITLDWPQRLPDLSATRHPLDWLQGCPLMLVGAPNLSDETVAWHRLSQLRTWLAERILHQPLDDWLQQQHTPEALALWCQARAGDLLPACCLSYWHSRSEVALPASPPLAVLNGDSTHQSLQLELLAKSISAEVDFAQYPTWSGQAAENGPWTRLRHQPDRAPISLWQRLSSRWIELVELANSQPCEASLRPALLACGAIPLADRQGLAWCEMARGLLFHWAQWDNQGHLTDYRVVAPTEWNFHPNGALAQGLTALLPGDTDTAQTMAAAFDPCVACSVAGQTLNQS